MNDLLSHLRKEYHFRITIGKVYYRLISCLMVILKLK